MADLINYCKSFFVSYSSARQELAHYLKNPITRQLPAWALDPHADIPQDAMDLMAEHSMPATKQERAQAFLDQAEGRTLVNHFVFPPVPQDEPAVVTTALVTLGALSTATVGLYLAVQHFDPVPTNKPQQPMQMPQTFARLPVLTSRPAVCHLYETSIPDPMPGSCYLDAFDPRDHVKIYAAIGPAPSALRLTYAAVRFFNSFHTNFCLVPGHLQRSDSHFGPLQLALFDFTQLAFAYNTYSLVRRPKHWKARLVTYWAIGACDLANLLFGIFQTIY